ncbi:phosphate signaling complex protein PhoU [Sphingomonas sp. MAH-20]|uniref:Phosphate-specific transport system accessory protein PhoU n=1 Tax=Sphingomonas horti TaxID=2682842 RepID=A0A6I4J0S6_9SPHN|nr:phosphate signaling complex protein PhoU [Sphingomonas sp. CGMCC 1.13658]MBA2919804.1 phosphate signaling complex protein PhoU [Sphingomonas sp. CGMCC 1.13658]MVO78045.1 phosphate signaling complex protein PhoU [Sphingomonas horti]
MTEHILRAFDEEIVELRGLISEMGGRAESAIDRAIDALSRRDSGLAASVVADDKRIDELEVAIERLAVQMMTLRAPMADDLRETVAALKIAGVIERIGDYAKNIAKRVPQISGSSKIEALSVLPAMAQLAGDMLHDVLDAFAARDWEAAMEVADRDRAVDDFYNSIFRTLLTFMMENPATIGEATHLLFIAKNLERIGDHATNVAEMVYFAARGEYMPERERGHDAL